MRDPVNSSRLSSVVDLPAIGFAEGNAGGAADMPE